jgi:hypothetical protein
MSEVLVVFALFLGVVLLMSAARKRTAINLFLCRPRLPGLHGRMARPHAVVPLVLRRPAELPGRTVRLGRDKGRTGAVLRADVVHPPHLVGRSRRASGGVHRASGSQRRAFRRGGEGAKDVPPLDASEGSKEMGRGCRLRG